MKPGRHEFYFQAGSDLFDRFEIKQFSSGNIYIKIVIEKNPSFMILELQLNGTLRVTCDRCLDEFDQPVEYTGKIYLQREKDKIYDVNDVIVIPAFSEELDTSRIIFDYSTLSLPPKCIHPVNKAGESLCNPEMIKRLEQYLVKEPDNTNVVSDIINIKESLN